MVKRVARAMLLVATASLLAGCVAASTGGDYVLAAGNLLPANLVVSGGRAQIDPGARVSGCIFLAGGELVMQPGAELLGDLVVFDGSARLMPGAIVRGRVVARPGVVQTAAAAQVAGGESADMPGWLRDSLVKYVLPLALLLAALSACVLAVARRRAPQPAR